MPNNIQAAELKQLSKAGAAINTDTIERTINPPKESPEVCIEDEDDEYEQLTIDGGEELSTSDEKKANDVLAALKAKFESQEQKIPNWDGTDNQVMKGYILKARDLWNEENPADPISEYTIENLMNALKWATDDFTAEEAFKYYMTH